MTRIEVHSFDLVFTSSEWRGQQFALANRLEAREGLLVRPVRGIAEVAPRGCSKRYVSRPVMLPRPVSRVKLIQKLLASLGRMLTALRSPVRTTVSLRALGVTAAAKPLLLLTGLVVLTASWARDTGEPCNLDMENAEVAAALRGLARQRGINLVFASELTAKRSFSIRNATFEEVLTRLTKYEGMTWHLDGDVYVVGTPERLQELFPELRPAPPPPPSHPKTVVASYLCNHIKAAEAVTLLGKLYPAQGGDGASLIVSLAPGPVTPSLASTYSAQGGMGAQPISGGDQRSESRTVLIRGPENLVEEALKALRLMDVPRRQVNIAVTIRDVTQDALKELGVSWAWSTFGFRERPGDGIQFGQYSRQPFNIDAILAALEKEGKAHLLASPNVSVLDGEKAFVLIGQRLLYPVLIGYSQANTPIFDKQEERVGIYLQVSALITDTDEIALTLYPQVSVVTGYLEQNGASYPQIATREAQTTLRVRNGQPIVIGGLIRQEEIKTLEKVPGLAEIPLFGELFKRRKTTKLNSHVVIIITPSILHEEASGSDEAAIGSLPLRVKGSDLENLPQPTSGDKERKGGLEP